MHRFRLIFIGFALLIGCGGSSPDQIGREITACAEACKLTQQPMRRYNNEAGCECGMPKEEK